MGAADVVPGVSGGTIAFISGIYEELIKNPEGFFTPEERQEILILSDDGSKLIAGEPCKELEDPAKKGFRGLWLVPSPR